MLVSNQRPLACETSSATSRLFVNVRYLAGIIRVARIAIFSQFERSRTCAQKFCRELSRILSAARNALQRVLISPRCCQSRSSFGRFLRAVSLGKQDRREVDLISD